MTDPSPAPALPTLKNADWLARRETQAVFSALVAAGHDARAVGGAVRNALMRLPVTDVDIATPAEPDAVIAACTAAGLKCVPTGLAHGTVTVISGGTPYEVTTLRRDVETFGRHATVAFTTDWAADARRRDFTVNALYCGADGSVLDPLGGYADLLHKHIRFIGDARERIREDYLRILRFFRFHAEYGTGAPDPEALRACVSERGGLPGLSAERIRAELVKLLVAPGARTAIDSMGDFGLLSPLLGAAPRPGLFARLHDVEAALGIKADAMARLSILAVAVEEDVDRLAERLRLSGAERDDLIVVDHRLLEFPRRDARATRRSLYETGAERWPRLMLAGAAAAGNDLPAWRALATLPERWPVPAFPLRGADVLDLGLQPGPNVGEILRDLEAWWVDGDFSASPTTLRSRLAEMIRHR
jgi:tRNA nucleotidyltransferase/poly(A) polymerase